MHSLEAARSAAAAVVAVAHAPAVGHIHPAQVVVARTLAAVGSPLVGAAAQPEGWVASLEGHPGLRNQGVPDAQAWAAARLVVVRRPVAGRVPVLLEGEGEHTLAGRPAFEAARMVLETQLEAVA